MNSVTTNKIIDFYDKSFLDLYYGWGARQHLGLHYGFYDQYHSRHNDAVLNMNRVMAKKAGIREGMKILDAGCGIGGSAIWLTKNFGVSVVGVTLSQKQKELAESLAKKYKMDHLTTFCTLNYLHTGFPSNSFDVIWALESMSYAEDKYKFLAEMKRLLKNNGTLIIADAFMKKEGLPAEENKLMKKCFEGWAVKEIAQTDTFIDYMHKLRYKKIDSEEITKNIIPSSKRFYWMGVLVFPFGKIFEWLRIRSKTHTKSITTAILQWKMLQKGVWGYFIILAKK